jgi:hypothetical protein
MMQLNEKAPGATRSAWLLGTEETTLGSELQGKVIICEL